MKEKEKNPNLTTPFYYSSPAKLAKRKLPIRVVHLKYHDLLGNTAYKYFRQRYEIDGESTHPSRSFFKISIYPSHVLPSASLRDDFNQLQASPPIYSSSSHAAHRRLVWFLRPRSTSIYIRDTINCYFGSIKNVPQRFYLAMVFFFSPQSGPAIWCIFICEFRFAARSDCYLGASCVVCGMCMYDLSNEFLRGMKIIERLRAFIGRFGIRNFDRVGYLRRIGLVLIRTKVCLLDCRKEIR